MAENPPEPVNSNLPSQQAKYHDLFQRTLDPIILLDSEEFTIVDANAACERVFQLSREQLTGKQVIDWVVEQERVEFLKTLRVAKRRYYPVRAKSHWSFPPLAPLTMDLVICSLSLNDRSEVIQMIARDVTQQEKAEQEAAGYLQKLEHLNEKLAELSTTDGLTKLSNVRHFKEMLAYEHDRSARYKRNYAIVFCDLDYFKQYNDRNGHVAGDEALAKFAEILAGSCRTVDLPARYGGEEFVVLCPDTSAKNAVELAERIRRRVEQHPFAHGSTQPQGKVTVSIGVAGFPENGKAPEEIIQSADQALYHSKQNGRNQITVSGQT